MNRQQKDKMLDQQLAQNIAKIKKMFGGELKPSMRKITAEEVNRILDERYDEFENRD